MADSKLSVTGDPGENFAGVAAALGEADASLPEEFRKVLLEAAERLAQLAREKVMGEPAFGPKHTGLRAAVAAGVAVKPTAGGAEITTSMPESDEAVIPRGLDDFAGWRHPVFGNKDVWVRQHGAFSWFMDTMAGGQSDVESSLTNALEAAAEKIAAA